jgi:hypothetical protein
MTRRSQRDQHYRLGIPPGKELRGHPSSLLRRLPGPVFLGDDLAPTHHRKNHMPKYDIPEDVQRAFDAHQVIDLLAADDSVGAVRIIAQYCGRNGQFALDIAAAAVTQLSEANDPDCAPISDCPNHRHC